MNSPIKFYSQSFLRAVEIENVGTYTILSLELAPF